MSKFAFVTGLRAAIHKSYAPVAVAGFIEDAAYSYAWNPGNKVDTIGAVVTYCQTTDTGKTKAPAPNTIASLILGAMVHILDTADLAGGRPTKVKGLSAEELKDVNAERVKAATSYAAGVRSAFELSVSCAAQARKDAAAQKKAAKGEPAPLVTVKGVQNDTISGEDTFTVNDDEGVLSAVTTGARALVALSLLTDDELSMLASAHGAFVQRMACIMGAAGDVASVMAGELGGATKITPFPVLDVVESTPALSTGQATGQAVAMAPAPAPATAEASAQTSSVAQASTDALPVLDALPTANPFAHMAATLAPQTAKKTARKGRELQAA